MADSTGSTPLLIGVDVGGTKIAGVVIEAPRTHSTSKIQIGRAHV